MANTPISGLNPGIAVSDTDLFPDVQTVGVGPVKVTGAQIKTYTSNSPTLVTPNIGVASGTSLSLNTSGSYSTKIESSGSATQSWTLVLPPDDGTSGYILSTDGSGNTTWVNPTVIGIDIDVNSTAITGGTNGHLVYDNAGKFGEMSAITTDGAAALTLGTQQTTQGTVVLANTSAGAFPVTVKSSNSTSAAWSFTLPTTAGTNKYALTTDGLGVSSWSQIDLSSAVTGTLPVGNGGTGQTSLAVHGVVIGNLTSGVNVTATGSAGQVFQSGGASADPVWSTSTFPSTATGTGSILRADGTNWVATTATYPTTTSAGTVLVSATSNAVTGTSDPVLGVQQTTQGSLVLANTAAGAFSTTLKSSNSASEAWTLTLPVSKGTNGYILTTDGTGVSSWTNPTALGIDIDVNSTSITGGTSGRLVYDNAGTFGEMSAITTNGSGTLTIGSQQTTQGSLVLGNTAAGAFATTVQSSNSASAAWTLTLPTTAGTNNYVLTTNGSGTSSWSQVSLTAGVTDVLPAANGGTGQSTNTLHGVLIGNAGNAINATAAGSAGQVLTSGGAAADPVWTTATFPSTATSTGTILRADGTNWSATTTTYPTTTSAGTILVSASANSVTGTATPTLGVAGTTVGTVAFANATSGSITLSPTTGALGSSTITMPATTGEMTVLGNSTTGSGSVVLATSPSLTTPALGVSTATSVAIGGATIGTDALAVTGTATMGSATYFPNGSATVPSIAHSGDTNCGIFFDTDIVAVTTAGSERLRFDASGRIIEGYTAALSFANPVGTITPQLQVISPGTAVTAGQAIVNNTTAANASCLTFAKSRGNSAASPSIVSTDDSLGGLFFNGYDGSNYVRSSSIRAFVGSTPGTTDMSGYITISTSASGSAVPTERVRVTNAGNVKIGGTANRGTTEGTNQLVIFNGTAPAGTLTNGASFYAAAGEMIVMDAAGNATTLSPHNFSLIPDGPSEELAWSYYSEYKGKKINVDMLKLARLLENLTGEKLVYIQE